MGAHLERDLPVLIRKELPTGWKRVQSSGRSWVAHSETEGLYFKAYLPRSSADWFKARIGGRARRTWRNSERLRRLGFHAPDFLCWGRHGNLLYTVSRAAPGESLGDYAYRNWSSPLRDEALHAKRQMLAKLGTLLGRLHSAGVYHPDLLPQNIIVSMQAIYLIDNDHNRHYRRVSTQKIKKNLQQTGTISTDLASRTDRIRFLRSYHLAHNRFSWEKLWKVAHKAHTEKPSHGKPYPTTITATS